MKATERQLRVMLWRVYEYLIEKEDDESRDLADEIKGLLEEK